MQPGRTQADETSFSILGHGFQNMNRSESILIGLFLGIACPYLMFVALWWSTAAFHFYVSPLADSVIAAMAMTGLGLGCLLDVIFLRRWVEKFYNADLRWVFVFYCGCFVVGFASFMGFPLGTFAFGIFAGAYVGRRARHHRAKPAQLRTTLNRTALLTSSLTTVAALPMGILGLREPVVGSLIQKCCGLDRQWLDGTAGYVLVGLLCLLLFAAQHWCVRRIGVLAFDLGPDAKPRILNSAG
jgi:hypothetical protein